MFKCKNPASTSKPNPQIEMTSFMDVIFIFLFVVMIGYAFKCAEESDEANARMQTANQLIAEANESILEYNRKEADLQNTEQQLEDLKGAVVGSRVIIITVTCPFDQGDLDKREEWERHLRVKDSSSKMLFESDFTTKDGRVQRTWDQLQEVLTKYVEEIKKNDRENLGEEYDTNLQGHTIIVFSVDKSVGAIMYDDMRAITKIIEELEQKNDDVY